MQHHLKVLAATAGWIIAVTLMATAETGGQRAWALLLTVAAAMPSMWLIFDYNRNRLRDEFVDALKQERRRADRLVVAVAQEFAEAEMSRVGPRRRT